jgi:flagellin-specific chaperone FliS
MQQEKIAARKGEAISKAIDIIGNGLKVSLDLEQGGELAERLDALYDYLVLRLLRANLDNDLRALEEVAALLEEVHGAWREIAPKAATTSGRMTSSLNALEQLQALSEAMLRAAESQDWETLASREAERRALSDSLPDAASSQWTSAEQARARRSDREPACTAMPASGRWSRRA